MRFSTFEKEQEMRRTSLLVRVLITMLYIFGLELVYNGTQSFLTTAGVFCVSMAVGLAAYLAACTFARREADKHGWEIHSLPNIGGKRR